MNIQSALQLYDEVSKEVENSLANEPDLENEIHRLVPFPPEAVYLGTCLDDNLPVVLNVDDTVPGHFWIQGEKFPFETIVKARQLTTHTRQDRVEFKIISNQDMYSDVASQTLLAMAGWCHGKAGFYADKRRLLVFIEDFDNMLKQDFDTLQNLTYLLLHGKQKGITFMVCAPTMPESWKEKFKLVFTEVGNRNYVYPNGKETVRFFIPE